MRPHLPQLDALVAVFTHCPWQTTSAGGHFLFGTAAAAARAPGGGSTTALDTARPIASPWPRRSADRRDRNPSGPTAAGSSDTLARARLSSHESVVRLFPLKLHPLSAFYEVSDPIGRICTSNT
jgi:hypothetical protein